MAGLIASWGQLDIAELNNGHILLDWTSIGGTFVTVPLERWKELVSAIRQAEAKQSQGRGK